MSKAVKPSGVKPYGAEFRSEQAKKSLDALASPLMRVFSRHS